MSQAPWGEPALWRRACRGDREAFAGLSALLIPRVRQFLFRLRGFQGDVDDLTQEVFVRLIEALPRLQDPARGRSFVLGVAANVHRESWGRRRVDPGLEEVVSTGSGPVERAASDELRDRATASLRALPVSLRQVLVLSVYEGLEPAEIAEVLGLASGAVRHRLYRARQLMAEALANFEEVRPRSSARASRGSGRP